MSEEWREMALEDCMSAIIDYRGKTPTKTTFGVPLVTAKIVKGGRIEPAEEFIAEADYVAWMRRGMPEKGDIVMTTEAPLGEVAQLDGRRIALAQRVITLRGKEKLLDNGFLRYLLQSTPVQGELKARATGTTVLGIKQSELRKVRLTLPPFPEQKRIAHILGTLDDKIELNRRMNATLEAMARALFQSWFVDFDPVRRNAARLQNQPSPQPSPNGRGRSAAEGEGAGGFDSLFPDSFEDSAMGEIPKGWMVKPLDEIADYQNGLALQKFRPADDEEPLPIVKIAQLKSGEATWEELSSPAINPACIIDTGDVVFSWSGSLVVKIWCGGRAALNQHLFKVTSGKYPKWFYLHWTQKHLADFQRIAEDKAVTMGHIKRSHLKEALCVVPDPKTLEQGSNRIAPLVEQMISLEMESRTLASLRDTLLAKLLSGELSIAGAEQIKGEIE